MEGYHKEDRESGFDPGDISMLAQILDGKIIKWGGKFSETLTILPDGQIKLPTTVDPFPMPSLFAVFGFEGAENIMSLAQKVEKHFPQFQFTFEKDPKGDWIKYTVSRKESL